MNQQVDDRWLLQERRGFALMLIISLCVAAAAFAGPEVIAGYYYNASWALRYEPLFVIVLPTFWGVLVLSAFFRYRLRGLWFLLGFSLALWWLFFFELIGLACEHGNCL